MFAADHTALPPVVFDLFEDLELVAGVEREVARLGPGEGPQGLGERDDGVRGVGWGRGEGDREDPLWGVGAGRRGEGGV